MLKTKLLGATAAVQALAIEDVFSTYLYTGNGSTQTITNGIDLAGEGGMVWIKSRSAATDNFLFDTIRGATKEINSNSTAAEATLANSLTAFNANGFSIGSATGIGVNAATYASWTFRKAPRWFDVVTWTGDGTVRAIPHNLGVVPGCVLVKITGGTTDNWGVWHRSLNNQTGYLILNSTAASGNSTSLWGNTAPTDTNFYVGNNGVTNASGFTYVAYLFAHDPLGPSGDGSDGLIACGSYTADGSGNATVNLGWEPQWLLLKRTDSATGGNWVIADSMRGSLLASLSNEAAIFANDPGSEAANGTLRSISSTGFSIASATASSTYIYIAIRRGPMRAPTSGTEVFKSVFGDGTPPAMESGFVVDAAIVRNPTATTDNHFVSRMTGTANLITNSTAAEGTFLSAQLGWDYNTGFMKTYGSTVWSAMFRRAPGFFDVVAWTAGSSTNRRLSHNLEVTPEFAISKSRSNAGTWWVYHKDLGSDKYINLDLTSAASTLVGAWPSPTETEFGVRESHYFASGWTVVTYLFATLPGVSKVGSYTGSSGSINIDCGFTNGARFVLVKRTNSTGSWYLWDSARGIVSANDPYLILNSTTAQITSNDFIDPLPAGFTLNTGSAAVNESGGEYIFLAIA